MIVNTTLAEGRGVQRVDDLTAATMYQAHSLRIIARSATPSSLVLLVNSTILKASSVKHTKLASGVRVSTW